MQLQSILLIGICFHVQAKSVSQKYNFTIVFNNNTHNLSLHTTHSSLCISDNDCRKNSWCNQNECECNKGWLTWYNHKQCSYKQISKTSTFIISLLTGGAGIDWFVLSRKNILYILTGLLKFLISIAACIWNRLALMNKNETSIIVAGCFGISLSFITIIWWFIDWMRILLNNFPDGNGAPLIS
jgi:hypothetical protein